jgi:uncharacterized protein (DUF58 family)
LSENENDEDEDDRPTSMSHPYNLPPRLGTARPTPPPLPRQVQPTLSPPPLPRRVEVKPAAPLQVRVISRKEPLLTPSELDRFKNLLVFARSTVEGYFSGKHKSPYRGSSAEFADYKEYVAGDDVSHLDWRVYGRARRLFIRQYEEETDMVVYLLVDTSASMSYAGEKRQSKYLLAAKVAAALAYLMIHQGDKASLVTFSDTINQYYAPGGTRRHLFNLVAELEKVKPASTTGIAQALFECHSLFKKRGRLVILSDFFTDRRELFEALGLFLHRKFEILLLHVLDPDELQLPDVSVARFVDMETAEQVQVEPEEIRAAYRETMRRNVDTLAKEADECRIAHALVDTRRPYLEAIEAYLGFRGINKLSVS